MYSNTITQKNIHFQVLKPILNDNTYSQLSDALNRVSNGVTNLKLRHFQFLNFFYVTVITGYAHTDNRLRASNTTHIFHCWSPFGLLILIP